MEKVTKECKLTNKETNNLYSIKINKRIRAHYRTAACMGLKNTMANTGHAELQLL